MTLPETVVRLRAEWDRLVTSPALNQARGSWAEADPRLAGAEFAELLAGAGMVVDESPTRNELLAALADQADPRAAHGPLAARVLLHMLFPAVIVLIDRARTALPDSDERQAVVLAAMLESIAAIPRPVDATRVRVAAYLKVAASRRVQRELTRHRLAPLPLQRDGRQDQIDKPYYDPGFGVVEVTQWLASARAARVITDVEAHLITVTRVHGEPLDRAREAHRLTLDTA